jgi:hypothetical protein
MSSQKLMLIDESYQENKASKRNKIFISLTSSRQKYDYNRHRELVRLTQAQ